MNLNSKKPEKRPLYVYYIIAVVIIILLNVFALPALSERSVKETDYTTFLKAVDRGKVYEATIDSDYIYYTMKVDGNDVYCKTVSVDDLYPSWKVAQQEDDEFHGQWWPWRHDVLW